MKWKLENTQLVVSNGRSRRVRATAITIGHHFEARASVIQCGVKLGRTSTNVTGWLRCKNIVEAGTFRCTEHAGEPARTSFAAIEAPERVKSLIEQEEDRRPR